MFIAVEFHPMSVHFPIALLLTGFVLDLIGLAFQRKFFQQAGFLLLILGAAGVVTAYLSGEQAEESVEHLPGMHAAVEQHEEFALYTLWLVLLSALFRTVLVILKKYRDFLSIISTLLLSVAIGFVIITAYYGGELVHTKGVHINKSLPDQVNGSHLNDFEEDD